MIGDTVRLVQSRRRPKPDGATHTVLTTGPQLVKVWVLRKNLTSDLVTKSAWVMMGLVVRAVPLSSLDVRNYDVKQEIWDGFHHCPDDGI